MFSDLFKVPPQSMEFSEGLTELRERNEIRLREAKEKLGTKWLLHPDNQRKKQAESYQGA